MTFESGLDHMPGSGGDFKPSTFKSPAPELEVRDLLGLFTLFIESLVRIKNLPSRFPM